MKGSGGTTRPMLTIPQRELRDTLSDVFDTVKWKGREYIVTRRGKPWVKISPIDEATDAKGDEDADR